MGTQKRWQCFWNTLKNGFSLFALSFLLRLPMDQYFLSRLVTGFSENMGVPRYHLPRDLFKNILHPKLAPLPSYLALKNDLKKEVPEFLLYRLRVFFID